MNISFEKLSDQDMYEFYAVFKEILSNEFPVYPKEITDFFFKNIYSLENLFYWQEKNLKLVLLAKDQKKIIGFAMIDSPYGGVSLCRWLGVLQNYQKNGIGKHLIEMWIEIAKKQGCHKAELAAQPTAREFYEKVGLKEEGKREQSYFGIDQYIFGKIIGAPSLDGMMNM